MKEAKYRTILYEKDKEVPNIAYITLNRPEKMNAISIGADEMTGEIQHAARRADIDDEVKVIILRAHGEDFSAGFDLSQVYRVYGGGPGVRPRQAKRLQVDDTQLSGMCRAILSCNKVTIVKVQGWCIEGAIDIVESCDIAIACKNAKFAHMGQRLIGGGMPLSALGLLQGHTKKLTELLITGRTISGEEAEQIGIITKAVEPEDLDSEVYNLAKAICILPGDAIATGKAARRLLCESLGLSSLMAHTVFHTLGTNLVYTPEEKDKIFIRDREHMGEREAFHKFHGNFEEALDKTKHFGSYKG